MDQPYRLSNLCLFPIPQFFSFVLKAPFWRGETLDLPRKINDQDIMRRFSLFLSAALLFATPHILMAQELMAQAPPASQPAITHAPQPSGDTQIPALPATTGVLSLSATIAGQNTRIQGGLHWRVFSESAGADGNRTLIDTSDAAAPAFQLPNAVYYVHVSYGLASATKRINLAGLAATEQLALNAGSLRISPVLGDGPIPPNRISLAIYVPERADREAKLVVASAKPNDIIGLPEGSYRIVSTYLDLATGGSTNAPGLPPNATNSVINAEVTIQSGKMTEVTLRHRAAQITLKLVNSPGSEALANTSFSVLTPGGDVIREMIGAFPSLVLAEGEYVVIARRDGKTFQTTFSVQSNVDRDVDILTQ